MKSLLFLLFFIPVVSHAQNCITNKDPKTGKNVKTGVAFLTDTIPNTSGEIIFTKASGKLNLNFTCVFTLKDNDKSNEKLTLNLKFANGNIKRFKSNSTSKISDTSGLVFLGLDIDLSQQDIAYIGKNAISSIRVSKGEDDRKGYYKPIDDADAQDINDQCNVFYKL